MTALRLASATPLLPADVHPLNRYLATLTTQVSRDTARTSADMTARLLSGGRCDALTLPWSQMRRGQMLRLRMLLEERYARVTANRMLSCTRSILKEVWRAGEIAAEQLQGCLDVPMLKGEDLPAGRVLSKDEVRALLALPGDRPICVRQRAMIALYYGTMCRRQEILDARLADYEPVAGALKIMGKGRRQAIVHLAAPDLRVHVDAWLAIRGNLPGPLLTAVKVGTGLVTLAPISGRDVHQQLRWHARECGVAPFSCHDLRRAGITHLDQAHVRLALIQQLARHKHVKTTMRYIRTDETELIEAAAGLSLTP